MLPSKISKSQEINQLFPIFFFSKIVIFPKNTDFWKMTYIFGFQRLFPSFWLLIYLFRSNHEAMISNVLLNLRKILEITSALNFQTSLTTIPWPLIKHFFATLCKTIFLGENSLTHNNVARSGIKCVRAKFLRGGGALNAPPHLGLYRVKPNKLLHAFSHWWINEVTLFQSYCTKTQHLAKFVFSFKIAYRKIFDLPMQNIKCLCNVCKP